MFKTDVALRIKEERSQSLPRSEEYLQDINAVLVWDQYSVSTTQSPGIFMGTEKVRFCIPNITFLKKIEQGRVSLSLRNAII